MCARYSIFMRLDTRAFARKIPRVRIDEGPFAVVSKGDLSVVFWGTIPLYHFRADDRVGRYTAAVELVRLHGLGPEAVADALGVSPRTMFRLLNRFDERGADGLLGRKGCRKPTKIRDAQERRLLELMRRGVSHRKAASRLGVSKSGVTGALQRLGWKEGQSGRDQVPLKSVKSLEEVKDQTPSAPATETCGSGAGVENPASQEEQPADAPSAPSADVDLECPLQDVPTVDSEIPTADAAEPDTDSALTQSNDVSPLVQPGSPSVDVDPLNRQGDRLMAHIGLLDDAAPLFAPGLVPKGGVLLAVPLLIASGVFGIASKVYGSIGPAFYGLRTSVLAFLVMALVRIKRAENLKEFSPKDLGRVLGLDRAPEMKTLRGKLQELAAREKGLEFMRLLAQERVEQHADDLGYLYIDGHVRVYNGDVKLPKTYVMQRRLAMPGTSDYWVGDQRGQPLLVITAEANEGMTKMLQPVLKEVRTVIGDRRATVVFDRGGNAACRIMPSRHARGLATSARSSGAAHAHAA